MTVDEIIIAATLHEETVIPRTTGAAEITLSVGDAKYIFDLVVVNDGLELKPREE